MTDEQLDRELREAVPYIDDAGFTSRVLKQLPRESAPARLRGAILISATLVATVLAYFLSSGARFMTVYLVQLSDLPVLWLLALALTAGLFVAGLGAAAALFKQRESVLMFR